MFKAGATRDGRLIAYDMKAATAQVVSVQWSRIPSTLCLSCTKIGELKNLMWQPMQVTNVQCVHLDIHKPAFAMDSLMDELAEKLGNESP